MPLVARWGSSFLKTITFLIIHRFLSLKVLLLIYCFSKSTVYNIFQFDKLFWIWWKVLDTIILWQDVGPCCEQTHAAFEVGLSLDQGQGVYSGWSDVVGSSQLRLCHTCILDVMMDEIASQITSLTIVYSAVYLDADQRKHQSSASLAFVRGIHRGPVNSPHKWPVTRKMFPFDDVIMKNMKLYPCYRLYVRYFTIFVTHCEAKPTGVIFMILGAKLLLASTEFESK